MRDARRLSVLRGRTIAAIDIHESKESVKLTMADGAIYRIESFDFEDAEEQPAKLHAVVGDLNSITNKPVTHAWYSESTDSIVPEKEATTKERSWSWIFYTFKAANDMVVLWWFAGFDGYECEIINLYLVEGEDSCSRRD